MTSTAESLTAACVTAAASGAEFRTIWNTILKPHPSVAGAPIQRLDGTAAYLEVPLITGQRIVFGPGPRDYALAGGKGDGAVI